MYVRYPVPVFEHAEWKGRQWESPRFLGDDERERILAARAAGDTSVLGAYPVRPDDAFFDALNVRGEHRHAILCVLPDGPVRVYGRSYAWLRQRVVLLDAPRAGAGVIAEWSTPRPMNTRLGPADGIEIAAGACWAVFAHLYGDHFVANRTLIDAHWRDPETGTGFRVGSAHAPGLDDFHDAVLHFRWPA